MKTYRGEGRTVTLTAPYTITSGQWVKIGSILGIAGAPAASGEKFACWVEGEYEVTKVGSQAWAEGVKVYFDNDLKKFTTANVSGGISAGVATKATGAGAGETTSWVRLSGSF